MNLDYEALRLKAVGEHLLFDVKKEISHIVKLASVLTKMPIALITLLDKEDQIILASEGVNLERMPRATSFCTQAIEQEDATVVPDATQDERFKHLPSVTGELNLRFYASANLESTDGYRIGTICVYDQRPNELSDEGLSCLKMLAIQVNHILRLKKQIDFATRVNKTMDKIAWTHAHNVRGPLTSVMGMISLIKSDNTKYNVEYVDLLEVAVNKLDEAVKEVINDSSILKF